MAVNRTFIYLFFIFFNFKYVQAGFYVSRSPGFRFLNQKNICLKPQSNIFIKRLQKWLSVTSVRIVVLSKLLCWIWGFLILHVYCSIIVVIVIVFLPLKENSCKYDRSLSKWINICGLPDMGVNRTFFLCFEVAGFHQFVQSFLAVISFCVEYAVFSSCMLIDHTHAK